MIMDVILFIHIKNTWIELSNSFDELYLSRSSAPFRAKWSASLWYILPECACTQLILMFILEFLRIVSSRLSIEYFFWDVERFSFRSTKLRTIRSSSCVFMFLISGDSSLLNLDQNSIRVFRVSMKSLTASTASLLSEKMDTFCFFNRAACSIPNLTAAISASVFVVFFRQRPE